MTTSNTNVVAYTNNIGQVINPGDEVVIVTTGYGHQVNTYKGTYIGLHKNGGAQCVKKVQSSFYADKATGERIAYSYFTEMNSKLNAFAATWRANNPGKYAYYSEPDYLAIREEYMSKVELKYEYVDRRTTLQRNRVYKIAA